MTKQNKELTPKEEGLARYLRWYDTCKKDFRIQKQDEIIVSEVLDIALEKQKKKHKEDMDWLEKKLREGFETSTKIALEKQAKEYKDLIDLASEMLQQLERLKDEIIK